MQILIDEPVDIFAIINQMSDEIAEVLAIGLDDKASTRNYLRQADFFDEKILELQDEAIEIWRKIMARYRGKEVSSGIPYTLAETPKLYAVDALVVAMPLVDKRAVRGIAEFFTVFYLMVHYFDDHVEHRDKFYSKFDFPSQENIDTQHGAAPFSFVLISLEILADILQDELRLEANAIVDIMSKASKKLALQTRYFADERKAHLSTAEVVEIKQRQVSGQSLSILADLISHIAHKETLAVEKLRKGLIYLGSLTQVTDDIRDIVIDTTLRNANVVRSCYEEDAAYSHQKIANIYRQEMELATSELQSIYNEKQLRTLLSLPFYPFMVDKQKVQSIKV